MLESSYLKQVQTFTTAWKLSSETSSYFFNCLKTEIWNKVKFFEMFENWNLIQVHTLNRLKTSIWNIFKLFEFLEYSHLKQIQTFTTAWKLSSETSSYFFNLLQTETWNKIKHLKMFEYWNLMLVQAFELLDNSHLK